MVPAQAAFTYEHSKKWSAEITQYDGYVFVSPKYNYGMSGLTKNAVNYLFNEWIGKPVLIITYGSGGGENASGQLKSILELMKLKVCTTRPMLPFKSVRPDGIAALTTSTLGEATRADWEDNKKEEILKGFGELLDFLPSQD
jgi:NAD(P)H-dependent FMN reductase